MMMKRWMAGVLFLGAAAVGADLTFGQNYPNRTIHIYTSEAGAANDFTARLIAQGLAGPLGQPVVVDNRPEALAIEIAMKAGADGYSLALAGTSFWVGPLLRKTSYDPLRDFLPITIASQAPNLLVVHPSLPVKNVRDLIALAKSRPGALNYASASIGGSPHLAAELFKAMAGVSIVHVPYRGMTLAFNDLIGGQVQLMMAPAGVAAPYVKSGRVKALGITSAEPSALAPGVPTLSASGLPGYESIAMQVLVAPANTPAAIIRRLNQEAVRGLNSAESKERLLAVGLEVVGSTPDQFMEKMKFEIGKTGKLIKDAGIKVE